MRLHTDAPTFDEACEPELHDERPTRFRLTPNVRAEAAERRRMTRDLAAATRDGMLLLHYQPRVALGTGQPLGAAALIRWPHRKRGLVSPRVFLPLAERSGQLADIGAWALATACRDAAGWPASCAVSVMLAPGQLDAGALLPQMAAALEGSGLAPERLEIALSESLLQDADTDTLLLLSAVRDLGVGVALDDFGVGLASLAMLRRLPLTAMKLDRSLVRDLPGCREDAAIVRAGIEAGRAMGMTSCADGVDSDIQRAYLAGVGCDQGQGQLFGLPLTVDQVRERLARSVQL